MVVKANIVKNQEIGANLNQGTGGFNAPVQSVNGKTGDVVLDASDVGALPDTTKIPSKVSDLENDEGYLTSYTETDPTVPAWAKEPQKPSYTFVEVGAEPAGAAVEAVNAHNTSENSHQDIRLLVQGLTTRLNALADSDDITLDQMSELVAYIKSNRSLINEITTKKINVSDIIDNLITNVPNRPLSASQGVVLKSMIETLGKSVPTKTSQLTNDSGFLTEIPSEYVTSTELSGKGYMSERKFDLGLYTIVKSVNNVKPDADGNVDIIGEGGSIIYKPTWDDLAVSYEDLVVTSDDVNYGGYHKVSDEVPTIEQLQKGGKISFNEGGTGIVTKNYPEGDMVIIERTNGAVIAFNGLPLAVIAFENGMSYAGNTFEKGIHFTQDDIVITHSLTVTDYVQSDEINPIPVEYLPKSHQFGEITTYVDTLTWDGNTEGLLSVDLLGDGTTIAYHITDVAPTLDDFAEGGWVAFSSGIKNKITGSTVLPASETVLVDANYNFIVALEDGATATVPVNGINFTLSAPKKGLYFVSYAQNSRFITEFTIKRFGGFWGKNVVPLPRKYAEPNFIDFVAMGLPTITDMAITTVEDVRWLDDIVEQLTKDCGYARICVKLTYMQPFFWDVEYDENAINGRVGHTDTEILLPAFYTINKDYYDEPECIDLIGRFRSSELYLRVGKDSVSGVVRHIDYLPLRTE